MHLRFVILMTDTRHVNAAPVFFGGRLLALNKKTGGIRPIVNGFTLRRLASKCANSFGTKKLASVFYPHQLGIGTPGGCEAAVHSARRYLEALPEDHVLVKLDFSNAFNSIHRREMLLAVHSRMPELYSFCCSAYNQPSVLFFGQYTVQSQEGVQQGDPIGPLLFCNTIQPLLSSLRSNLNIGYLDDVTLTWWLLVWRRSCELAHLHFEHSHLILFFFVAFFVYVKPPCFLIFFVSFCVFLNAGCIVCIVMFSICMVFAAEAKYMLVLLYVSTSSVTDLC